MEVATQNRQHRTAHAAAQATVTSITRKKLEATSLQKLSVILTEDSTNSWDATSHFYEAVGAIKIYPIHTVNQLFGNKSVIQRQWPRFYFKSSFAFIFFIYLFVFIFLCSYLPTYFLLLTLGLQQSLLEIHKRFHTLTWNKAPEYTLNNALFLSYKELHTYGQRTRGDIW